MSKGRILRYFRGHSEALDFIVANAMGRGLAWTHFEPGEDWGRWCVMVIPKMYKHFAHLAGT